MASETFLELSRESWEKADGNLAFMSSPLGGQNTPGRSLSFVSFLFIFLCSPPFSRKKEKPWMAYLFCWKMTENSKQMCPLSSNVCLRMVSKIIIHFNRPQVLLPFPRKVLFSLYLKSTHTSSKCVIIATLLCSHGTPCCTFP